MNDFPEKLEPLSPELASLISAAAGEDGPDKQTEDRLYRRLCMTLVIPLLPLVVTKGAGLLAKAATSISGVKAVSVALLVASGVGVGGYLMTRAPASDTVSTRKPSIIVVRSSKQDHRAVAMAAVTAPDVDTPDEVSATVTVTGPSRTEGRTAAPRRQRQAKLSSSKSSQFSMADEQRLVEAARRALAQGETGTALKLLKQHRQRFAAGQLAEERDALRVMSFAKQGRYGAAKTAAGRFFSRYPHSVFKDAVTAALETAQ